VLLPHGFRDWCVSLTNTCRFNFRTLASDEQDELDKDIEQWKLFHIER